MAAVLVLASLTNAYSQTPLKLNLTAGVNMPMGDFKDMYKTGISIEAAGFYSLPNTGADLSISIGYNGFSYKNEYFTNLVLTNLGVTTSFAQSWTATDIPIMVGVKYNFPTPVISPYIWGEAGVHILSFSDRFNGQRLIGNSTNPTTFNYSGVTETGSETAFAYSIGAGISFPVAPKVSFDLNLKYNGNSAIYSKAFEVFRNNTSNFVNPEFKNMSFLTFRAGILLSL